MHKNLLFQIRKILYGLVLLGFLAFLVGVANLPVVHAQDGGVVVPAPSYFLKPLSSDVPVDFGKLTPSNGATLSGTTVTMTWESASTDPGIFYLHCVDKTNNDICDANVYYSDNDINRTLTNLDPGSTYYWQAWACIPLEGCRGANYGDWWSYTVPSVVVKSIGTQDGWVLESSQGSGVGGTMNATAATFQLGDDVHNRQYRAILSFDTSTIPTNAVIQSAVLKIYKGSTVGPSNPFSILGSLYASIRKGYFSTNASLQLTDFNASPNASNVGMFGSTPVIGWYSAALNSNGLLYINKGSLTQFRLAFSIPTNANNVANYMTFVSGDGTNKPQLVIKYNMP